MRNEELFDDKKDIQIAQLKLTIAKFKNYDEERKKYYEKHMRRLGELESLFCEMQDTTVEGMKAKFLEKENAELKQKVEKLTQKTKEQKEQLRNLNLLVERLRKSKSK